ncbi:MAG: Zn-ribbon domain-containing OB-fold protein [Candidatus Bathyarchaeum sp.]|nr:MAG: Zn-ribbon domain-containing OB-fold protein [Candidatus Bathyarchaeum sp.]
MKKLDKPLSLKSARTLQITYNLPISRTSKFWEGLKEGKVYATTCQKCGMLHFPPVADCGNCGLSNVKWTELDGEGEIVTFTQVFVKPASFSKEPSYIVAIARLKEGVKALAWLTGIKREDVKVGMKVKLVARVTSDGRATYEFIPV